MKITKIKEDDVKTVYNVKIAARDIKNEEPTRSVSPKVLLKELDLVSSEVLSINGLNLSNKTSSVDTNYTVYKLQKNKSVVSTIDNVTKVKRTTNRKKSSKNNETNKTTT
jgi:hypothetical protein